MYKRILRPIVLILFLLSGCGRDNIVGGGSPTPSVDPGGPPVGKGEGVIVVTVVEDSGKPIEGATISAISGSGASVLGKQTTDTEGKASIIELPFDHYKVTATKLQYKDTTVDVVVKDKIPVSANIPISQDIHVEIHEIERFPSSTTNKWSHVKLKIGPIGKKPVDYSIVPDFSGEQGFVLQAQANNAISMYVNPIVEYGKTIIPHDFPIFSWRWNAKRLPQGADPTAGGKDDSVGRVLLVFSDMAQIPKFDNPLSLKGYLNKVDVIGYFWSQGPNLAPESHFRDSDYPRTIWWSVEHGEGNIGKWLTVERNIYDDFRKAFNGKEPPPVKVVIVYPDTNSTKTYAECYFDDFLSIRKGPGAESMFSSFLRSILIYPFPTPSGISELVEE